MLGELVSDKMKGVVVHQIPGQVLYFFFIADEGL